MHFCLRVHSFVIRKKNENNNSRECSFPALKITQQLQQLYFSVQKLCADGSEIFTFLESERADLILIDLNLKGVYDGVISCRIDW